ncbi:acyltransferase family protein [Stenotrophomonas mori]|uniref:Heparan-alpha-glucosaminide N-acetyltransferase domain-containing protein n=1 Tax=Stenotrophomonas mori TaxID=2871096 RepID=A0ABT0SI87_9GAMM|nr:heparan-alpha-glucosaminide N-acetyltransferase domain-containing protein [Stenotrophomonas mori]MCL7715053.1 heparan-alpha-glucosaminide N-acetyltransferase domain-containing protein [Stenotrophomonas mori]
MTRSQSSQAPARYASVDALRGLTVAAMLLVNNPGTWSHVYAPLAHAEWNGCTPTDLVFPFFLVVVGVSIGLGVVPRVEQGADRGALTRSVLMRALRIIGLGMLLHLLAWWWLELPHYRPLGVLQRIGVCFAAGGLAAIWLRPRTQGLCLGALLAGYAALLAIGGSLAPLTNLPSRVDTALLGPLLYQHDPATGQGHDPEGLLSTLGALASTLVGLHAGALLRRRPWRLLPAALLLLAAGALWSHWLPFNKNLWTPSYVLWTAGWASAALWLAHILVDCRQWPPVGRRFGVNAITAYAGSSAMVLAMMATGSWNGLWQHGFDRWLTPLAGAQAASLAMALAFVALWWWPLAWMDRRGIYLKI